MLSQDLIKAGHAMPAASAAAWQVMLHKGVRLCFIPGAGINPPRGRGSMGTLNIELGSGVSGTQLDLLNVTGVASQRFAPLT